jgi:hypothetical protein
MWAGTFGKGSKVTFECHGGDGTIAWQRPGLERLLRLMAVRTVRVYLRAEITLMVIRVTWQ